MLPGSVSENGKTQINVWSKTSLFTCTVRDKEVMDFAAEFAAVTCDIHVLILLRHEAPD